MQSNNLIASDVLGAFQSEGSLDIVDGVLSSEPALSKVMLFTFPDIDCEEKVDQLIDNLSKRPGWKRKELKSPYPNLRLIQLRWTTPQGKLTTSMGLAPLLSMPPVRRAPHVALVLWPGGAENRFRENTARFVPLADASLPADMTREAYDELWSKSETDTRNLMVGHHRDLHRRHLLMKSTFVLRAA